MANDKFKPEAKAEAPKSEVKAETPKPASKQPEYTAVEFAALAKKLFNTAPECVLTAFKAVGVEKATVEKAAEIIKNFLKKEVKK